MYQTALQTLAELPETDEQIDRFTANVLEDISSKNDAEELVKRIYRLQYLLHKIHNSSKVQQLLRK